MGGNIEIIQFYCNDTDMESIGELYCSTFLVKDFSHEDRESAIKNINQHASYEGFKGRKAKDKAGSVVGFTYGYTSLPEQFYHRKIAEHLSEAEANTWLNNCFEFVELAVSPSYKRLGIASKLHDALLENIHYKTAILTTGVENSPAINLYKQQDWQLVKSDVPVISGDNLQVIMGKEFN